MARENDHPETPPGGNIYRLRLEHGLSLRALAEKCVPELDHTTIRRIERNEGYTQDTLERVAKVFNVTVQDLFLPQQLEQWPSLNAQTQERIAHSIRDAATAQRYKTTG